MPTPAGEYAGDASQRDGSRAAAARVLRAVARTPPAASRSPRSAATSPRAPAAARRGPENIHLTLAFVGDVAPDRIAGAGTRRRTAARARRAVRRWSSIRLGAFRDAGSRGSAPTSLPPALADARMRACARGSRRSRFRVETRPFRRARDARAALPAAAAARPDRADRLARRTSCTLIGSELRADGLGLPRTRGVAAGGVTERRAHGAGPRATGRAGSAHHSLHEPG